MLLYYEPEGLLRSIFFLEIDEIEADQFGGHISHTVLKLNILSVVLLSILILLLH